MIKCGLAPVLIDLMQRGYATAFAMNGAAAIHDFEIALAGHTSEDVEAVLPDGRFGAAEETGREMNAAIAAGDRDGLGMGEALGRRLDEIAAPDICAGEPGAAGLARGDARHRACGRGNGYAAHASGGGRGGHRQRYASRFPACCARWWRDSTMAESI